jgi:hypothetical protein
VNRPVLLVVLALSVCPLAAATADRDATALPHATMRELALAPRSLSYRVETHEQGRPKLAKLAQSNVGAAVTTKPTIAAPPVGAAYRASWENGGIPSDAAGAVSANYLLSASNASIVVQDRSGASLLSVALGQFWHDPAFEGGFVYDSRVAYDAAADRWVIVTLYDVSMLKSTILIAVSDGGDPTRGWQRFRYRVDPSDFEAADLTRLALTRDSIVITTNIYDDGFFDSRGANLYVIKKSAAYGGVTELPITVTRTPFFDLVPADSDTSTAYLLVENFGSATIYSYNADTRALTTVGRIDSPIVNVSDGFDSELGEQLGSSLRLDCGVIYIHNAVARNGVVWASGQLFTSSPSRSTVVWWRAKLGTPIIGDGGVIEDATGKTMYAFPSIAVNRNGAVLLGYSVFSSTAYPSAGYSYVDASGRLSAPAILKAGEGAYGNERWADFSATVVDPMNDTDFWTMQTVAAPVNTAKIRWVTWWGKIAPATAAPAKPRTARH